MPKTKKTNSKPRPDFPLWLHPSGRWCKKIKGRFHYFGKADAPEAAESLWIEHRDDLLAGREPRKATGELTVRDLVNQYLTGKHDLVECGELRSVTFKLYKSTCGELTQAFGLTRAVTDLGAEDFRRLRAALAKRLGPAALAGVVSRVRGVFRYATENGLIAEKARFGTSFEAPSDRALREVRNAKATLFSRRELRMILKAASPPMKAMVLLGVNAGIGNADLAHMPKSAINFKTGWLNLPRRKTGISRTAPLWPETLKAVQAAIAVRPEPRDPKNADRVFLTRWGQPWYRDGAAPITLEFRKLLKRLGIQRTGLSFYTLRRQFQTIGEEAGDPVAVSAIMGHAPKSGDMAAVYRQRIAPARLFAVAKHMRRWLYTRPKAIAAKAKATGKKPR